MSDSSKLINGQANGNGATTSPAAGTNGEGKRNANGNGTLGEEKEQHQRNGNGTKYVAWENQ